MYLKKFLFSTKFKYHKYHKLKFLVFVIFHISMSQLCLSQPNLVSNGSFEEFYTCPDNAALLEYAIGWIDPDCGTADYYNCCSILMNVPGDGVDHFQHAHSGVAYAGFYAYSEYVQNGREYIQKQLNSPLSSNSCYLATFYINNINWANCAVNKLGIYFSTNQIICLSSSNWLNYMPQIFTERIIADTLKWVCVKGIFNANGGEQFITIGNFFDDLSIDTLIAFPTQLPNHQAYYLIDDVSVIPVDSLQMPAYAGHDTSIVIGDSVFIGQEITNLDCNWYANSNIIASGISGLYVSPTVTTQYVVEQNLCGVITYDTVLIKVNLVGIEEKNTWQDKVTIYPNPTTGNISIKPFGNTMGKLQVDIMDVTGKTIFNTSLTINEGICNFNLNIEKGIYFITITEPESNEKVVKNLIVQ